MATEELDQKQLVASLEKASQASEVFQLKNAELEKVNDQLRMDNVQLTQTVDDLTEEVNSLREKLSAKDKLKINGSPKACHSPKSEKKSKNRLSKSDPAQEVKTLRKVKQELEEQLSDSKSTTLSFHASFQAEFDLRTQIEQRLDELRERYERLIMENDQLRQILQAHNITAPSPPGLRSLPGSRRKKHAPKARPMTMYSDLSLYTEGSSRNTQKSGPPALVKQNTQPILKKASSLHSLEDKANSAELKDDESSKKPSVRGSEETPGSEETKTTIMAETAQRVAEESSNSQENGQSPAQTSTTANDDTEEVSTSQCSGEDKNEDKTQNDTQESKEAIDQGEEKSQGGTQELSPSKGAYPVDTLMWNAKGFLNRIEKLNEDEGVSGGEKKGDGTTSNERDENELTEMLSSVSIKQLESAKAFLEASVRKSSPDGD